MSPAEAAKWSERERARYTVAKVVRYWCEIPDDHGLFLDQRTRLPLPDAAYPLVETYTLLLVDAIDTYQLRYETTDSDWSNSEGPPPWSTRVIRQDALKRWFERCRWPQRPAFLFWREDVATGPSILTEDNHEGNTGEIREDMRVNLLVLFGILAEMYAEKAGPGLRNGDRINQKAMHTAITEYAKNHGITASIVASTQFNDRLKEALSLLR